jgi:hypothetical protein
MHTLPLSPRALRSLASVMMKRKMELRPGDYVHWLCIALKASSIVAWHRYSVVSGEQASTLRLPSDFSNDRRAALLLGVSTSKSIPSTSPRCAFQLSQLICALGWRLDLDSDVRLQDAVVTMLLKISKMRLSRCCSRSPRCGCHDAAQDLQHAVVTMLLKVSNMRLSRCCSRSPTCGCHDAAQDLQDDLESFPGTRVKSFYLV